MRLDAIRDLRLALAGRLPTVRDGRVAARQIDRASLADELDLAIRARDGLRADRTLGRGGRRP